MKRLPFPDNREIRRRAGAAAVPERSHDRPKPEVATFDEFPDMCPASSFTVLFPPLHAAPPPQRSSCSTPSCRPWPARDPDQGAKTGTNSSTDTAAFNCLAQVYQLDLI